VVHCGNGISGQQRAKNPQNRGQNFFHSNRPIWVSKNPKFYADFKKCSHTLVTKCTQKSFSQKTVFRKK
jgi:hypothetical protein